MERVPERHVMYLRDGYVQRVDKVLRILGEARLLRRKVDREICVRLQRAGRDGARERVRGEDALAGSRCRAEVVVQPVRNVWM